MSIGAGKVRQKSALGGVQEKDVKDSPTFGLVLHLSHSIFDMAVIVILIDVIIDKHQ